MNPGKARGDGIREGLNRQGLRESRQALEQDVSATEQPDEQASDHFLLAHQHLSDLALDQAAKSLLIFGDFPLGWLLAHGLSFSSIASIPTPAFEVSRDRRWGPRKIPNLSALLSRFCAIFFR